MTNKIFEVILAQNKTKPKTEKQQKIIEAAIQLFADKGYANTSTAEIAKTAGVSEGTIFKHYGTKDRLLLSLILPFAEELFPRIAQDMIAQTFTANTENFEQFLRSLIHNRIAFLKENIGIAQVFIKELMYNDGLRKELLPFVVTRVKPLLEQVVEQFKARGELVDLPTDAILRNVASFLFGFLASRYLFMEQIVIREEEVEAAVQFIMRGISNPAHTAE